MTKISSRNIVTLVAVVTLAAVLLAWLVQHKPADKAAPAVGRSSVEASLEIATESIAAAEDGRYRVASDGWRTLLRDHSGDTELRVNQAVTLLKWIDELTSMLSSGAITDPAEIRQREDELANAFIEAEQCVDLLSNELQQDARAVYLAATLLETKSKRLAPPQDATLRQQAAQRIVQALQAGSNSTLLVSKLDDLAQEFVFDNAELAKATADGLLASWRASPRNLYLLVRTGESLLELQDMRLLDLLDPSIELAKPMMSMLQPRLGARSATDIVAAAKEAIGGSRWPEAQALRLWFNVLKSSTAFRPDMRLVKPDILALLRTGFTQRMRATIHREATPSDSSVRPMQFESLAVLSPDPTPSAVSGIWYDHDVDGDFELLLCGEKKVSLVDFQSAPGTPLSILQELDVPLPIDGMIVADLYEVDATDRPKVARTVAELMQQPPASTSPANAEVASNEQIKLANQHDTVQEIVAWGSAGVQLLTSTASPQNPQLRTLSLVADVPGLSSLGSVKQIVPMDIDSDGDLDLYCITSSGMRILQNNGNRTFEDVSQFSSHPSAQWMPTDVIPADFDRDLDMDLICVSDSSPHVAWMENILHSQFRFAALSHEPWRDVGPCYRLEIEEIDGNGSWDIYALAADRVYSLFSRMTDDGQLIASHMASLSTAPRKTTDMVTGDFDNDGCLDIAVASDDGLHIHRGATDGSFVESPVVALPEGRASRLAVADSNHDGTLEIFSIVDAAPRIVRQVGEPVGDFVQVRVRGINDVNGGGRINHYSVGTILELSSAGRFQAKIVRDPVVHFGLGNEAPRNLRVIFNNGLTQNIESVPRNTVVHERQELKGSCPFVYGWDGTKFELITDLLWNAPLGLQIARGKVLPDRRWEHLVLPGQIVQPRDGTYELRITEELWEIAYFDHVSLTAVDHPKSVSIYSNEKVGPPSIAEPKLFHDAHKIYPASARDGHGRDIRDQLSARDSVFAQPFRVQYCQGLCEPHYIELDFGKIEFGKEAKLFLTGWLHPTDTSLNIALDQNPILSAPEPPSLWVPNETGQFVCVNPFTGFPGGKTKSIVIEIGNPFLTSDRRLRIAGSQQIYWDEAFVTVSQPTPLEIISTPLKIDAAQLRYRGFGRLMHKADDQPHWYDYQQTDTAPKWPPLDGPLTRYGAVDRLLEHDDDQMVIMSSGDEIIIRFQIPSNPVPEGFQRDFVLHCTGWDKDSDVNTLAGYGALPIPFKAMQSYPAPPSQAKEQAQVFELNRPTLTNRRSAPDYWRLSRQRQRTASENN